MAGNREVLRVVQILEEIDVKCMVFCPFLDIINCTYIRMKKLSHLVLYVIFGHVGLPGCKWLVTYKYGHSTRKDEVVKQ